MIFIRYDMEFMLDETNWEKFDAGMKKNLDWGKHRKSFPLKMERWLRANVGRKWSEVYSEYSRKLSSPEDKYAMRHSLGWLVEEDVYKDGNHYYNSRDERVLYNFVVYNDTLIEIKEKRNKYKEKSPDEKRWNWGVVWRNNEVFANIDNVWYKLILGNVKDQSERDLFFGRLFKSIDSYQKKLVYGRDDLICVGKKQLNKQEIRRLGLNNYGT